MDRRGLGRRRVGFCKKWLEIRCFLGGVGCKFHGNAIFFCFGRDRRGTTQYIRVSLADSAIFMYNERVISVLLVGQLVTVSTSWVTITAHPCFILLLTKT